MAFIQNIGVPELLIILVIVVIVLGPKRIPAAAKSVGHGMRNFKESLGSGSKDEEANSELDEKTKTEV